ncbi:MAG: cyclic peptide export ABC transporter [Bacteroidota bacterium]
MSIRFIFTFLFCLAASFGLKAQVVDIDEALKAEIYGRMEGLMEEGDIPGLSLVIVQKDSTYIKTFGWADVEQQILVEPQTYFELASCTKAFTGLAVLRLQKEGKLDLDRPLTDYLPWLTLEYAGEAAVVRLRHLLYHTSGIPDETLGRIMPQPLGPEALETTVRSIEGSELVHFPGTTFEYATINYDILGLIIQQQSGQLFEDYIREKILLPLQMNNSWVGQRPEHPGMAQGHKISFFDARPYDAPVYGGNNPAGYLISNAEDMAQWLRFQLGYFKTGTLLDSLRLSSHTRDASVPPRSKSMSSYSAGWDVSMSGDGKLYHMGQNPNYTAFVAAYPEMDFGVAILGNSNSNYTTFIERHIIAVLQEREVYRTPPDQERDNIFSLTTIALLIFIFSVLTFIGMRLYNLFRGRARFRAFKPKLSWLGVVGILPIGLFLYGLYLLPEAYAGFPWDVAKVWAPMSFVTMIYAVLAAMAISLMGYLVSAMVVGENRYLSEALPLLVLSLLSGLANTAIIILVTSAVGINIGDLGYIFYYFIIAFSIYIIGRKVVQTRLIQLTLDLIYDIRNQLISKIFSTTYQEFEKIDRGRVYATLNDDTSIIGNAANVVVSLLTNTVMTIAAFIYLTIISPQASIVTILSIVAIATIYYFVTKSTDHLFEKARDIAGRYLGLLNGLVDGFKELSLHAVKRLGYRKEAEFIIDDFRHKLIEARVRFVNAFLVGESLLVAILGLVAFVFPQIFPRMESDTILSFIIVMLYLIGPINGILSAIPTVMQMRVSWRRIQGFLKDIPGSIDLESLPEEPLFKGVQVQQMSVKGLHYRYDANFKDEVFALGPVSFELRSGEVLFIVGGNGSGKTTLCKILTGLYESHGGEIRVDGKLLKAGEVGEYYSAAFNPAHLFRKLYEIDEQEGGDRAGALLQTLGLSDKVEIKEGAYSTLNLSQGQRKRLALLQCYLEDRPIYLFDEWAADQDPDYRRFFYKELIPEMKRKGKIIIAITHDDHYFSEADKILKLNQGQQEHLVVNDSVEVT